MKVELIKQLFDGEAGYKIKDMTWCCDRLKDCPTIELLNEYDYSGDETYKELVPSMMIHDFEIVNSWGDEFQNDYYYRIKHCPFCGEPIEISIVAEEDVSNQYNELSKQRKILWEKCLYTDSKKKERELLAQVRELDKKINWYHELSYHDEKN